MFEGFLYVPATGQYSFSANVDDAVRVVVGDLTVLDASLAVADSLTGSPFALEKGLHPLRIEFRQYGGASGLRLDWT